MMFFETLSPVLSQNQLTEDLPTYQNVCGHMAENVAARESTHLSQMINGGFNLFDYGPEENMERYGQTEPPRVPLENTPIPGKTLFQTFFGFMDF